MRMSVLKEVEQALQEIQDIFDATGRFCSLKEEIQELEAITDSLKQSMFDMNQVCDQMEMVIEDDDDDKISLPQLIQYQPPEKIEMNIEEIMSQLNNMDLERINSSESNKSRSSFDDDDNDARSSISNSDFSIGIFYNEKLRRKEAVV